MKKDPAFLFYPGSWLKGTQLMTRSHKGAYMDLLMAQFSNGHLSLDDIQGVLGSDYESMWECKLKKCFDIDAEGLFYNAKMDNVMQERAAYKVGRLKNLKGKKKLHKETHKEVPHGNPICLNEDINTNKALKEDTFKSFWDSYHTITGLPKTDMKNAEMYWKRLNKTEQQKAIDNIQEYYNCLPIYESGKPIKKARTYLSDKSFNDEFVKPIVKAKGGIINDC